MRILRDYDVVIAAGNNVREATMRLSKELNNRIISIPATIPLGGITVVYDPMLKVFVACQATICKFAD